jgi:carbon monoxide dehydrogenase subunit G
VRLDEEMTIQASPDAVWTLFQDPRRVAACMPGAQFDEQLDDGSYRGSMQVKFGPKVVGFGGTAVYVTDEEARTGELTATGSDRRGSSRAALTLSFVLQPAGAATLVRVAANARFSGPLSQFAETGGVRVAQVLMQDFAQRVAATLTPAAAPVDPAPVAAPSTAEPAGSSSASRAPAAAPSPVPIPHAAHLSVFRLLGGVVRAQLVALRRRLTGGRRAR